MTDPLLPLLMAAYAGVWPDVDASQPQQVEYVERIIAALPPDKADALRCGLLLAEVGRLSPGYTIDHFEQHGVIVHGGQGSGYPSATGPTLLAALQALLAQLQVRS